MLPSARGQVTLIDMEAIPKRPLTIGLAVLDEKELVARLRAGDRAGYAQLVRTDGGRLLAVARRLVRNEEDARGCVQGAFLQAVRHIEKFEQRSSLGSWLHRIVVNPALMKIRVPEFSVWPHNDVSHGFRVIIELLGSSSVRSV